MEDAFGLYEGIAVTGSVYVYMGYAPKDRWCIFDHKRWARYRAHVGD